MTRSDRSATIAVVIAARDPGAVLDEVLGSLGSQQLPDGAAVEVIIVDDGSRVPLDATLPGNRIAHPLRVIRRDPGGHRGEARNTGCAATQATHVLFLDADCVPGGPRFILAHLRAFESGCVASHGMVAGSGSGFWHEYQQRNAVRRMRGAPCPGSGTAANLMVSRTAFVAAGGFDPDFAHYGFEDRDLLLRLARIGPVVATRDAVASHRDDLRLACVARKLAEAGEHSAPLFRARHAGAYRALGYAAWDATLHPVLTPVGRTLGALALACAGRLDRWLHVPWVPFAFRRGLVKATSALAFLHGTTRTVRRRGPSPRG